MRGFLAGVTAGLLGVVVLLLLGRFNWQPEIDFYDFAGTFALGTLPITPFDRFMGHLVDLIVSGILGIAFAYLVPAIGSRYLIFKGWFFATALWYMFYPLFLMILTDKIPDLSPLTSLTNAILAGLFGVVMALIYGWLTPEAEKRPSES